jgi:putative RNA 2'-phosphotransferase
MPSEDHVEVSKRLSYILRHAPQSVGLSLDEAGWVDVAALLDALARHGMELSESQLADLVRTSDKQRFALSDDARRIRANQGHSLPVELGYKPAVPPEILFHGTVARSLESIRAGGLNKGNRSHVHLSPDVETAAVVGSRRGKPVVLRILAKQMHDRGFEFYLTPNNVWLTDHVPPEFIEGDSG